MNGTAGIDIDSLQAETVTSKEIFIVAGEASGDLYGSRLIEAARDRLAPMNFMGVGSSRMRLAGCDVVVPAEELSVMGIVEVIGKLRIIRQALRTIEDVFKNKRLDLVVLIDFADFNIKVAKLARKYSIPVLYYISPKVWIWRKGRAKKIAKLVDRIAVIFPFEVECYAPYDVQVDYVGHPLLDEPQVTCQRDDFLESQNLGASSRYIGLFPGSRESEITFCFKTLLDTASQINRIDPKVRFLMPVAPTLSLEELEQSVRVSGLPISLLTDASIYNVTNACDAVLCVSGTVTLQVALTGVPCSLFYKVAPLSYFIGKLLVDTPFVGLPNIVAGKKIVSEFIQHEAVPETMSTEIMQLVTNISYRKQVVDDLKQLPQMLGQGGAAKHVVTIMTEMIKAE